MKRQNKFLVSTTCATALLAGTVLLSGCGAMAMPSLTEEQEEQVVQYAADAVMRHVDTYNTRLADLSLYDDKGENPEESKEPASTMDPTVDTPVIDKSEEQASYNFAQVLFPEGFSMEYLGDEVLDSYPQTSDADVAVVIDASQGKKLLVMSFAVTNNGADSSSVDIGAQKPYCVIKINNTDKYFALVTFLDDDLVTYRGNIEAGEEKHLVMIAEIPEEKADNIETIKLSVTVDGKTATGDLR